MHNYASHLDARRAITLHILTQSACTITLHILTQSAQSRFAPSYKTRTVLFTFVTFAYGFIILIFLARAPLFKAIYDEGLCDLVTTLESSTENDSKEKILQALQVLLPACRSNFKKNNLGESLKKWHQEWQEEMGKDNTGYLGSLVELVGGVIEKLS